jgi:hypothetical protein
LGTEPPGFDGCRGATLANRPILLEELDSGNHLCLRTSEGNVTEIRIDGSIVFRSLPPRFGTVDMTFTTFESG